MGEKDSRESAVDAFIAATHEYLETPLCYEHTSPDYTSTCGTCISWAIARVHLHNAVEAVSP